MITNLQNFKLDLKHFYEVVTPATHLEFQRRIVIKLHQLIVFRNSQMPNHPVDTGWARANWGVSLGKPKTSPIGTYPGQGNKTTLSVFDLTGVIAAARPFGIIWVWNNVPYITKLENGHSTQAPSGMVEGALNDIQTFMNRL